MVQVALVGQPNVGKSSLFSRLTGVGVISSNYSGTTVEFEESVIVRKGVTVVVHDLPGTYSLSGNSSDEDVAIRMLSDPENDAVVVVADAMNLESSLVLCFEVIELGLPAILALNKFDASKKKFATDFTLLSEMLGIPVMPVSARTSEGVDALADAICEGKARVSDFRVKYHDLIENDIKYIENELGDLRFSKRGVAIKILEGTDDFVKSVPKEVNEKAKVLRENYRDENKETPGESIGRDRYSTSDVMIKKVQIRTQETQSRADRISDLMITPITGVPILLAICLGIFLTIVYLGSFLDNAVSTIYDFCIGNYLSDVSESVGGSGGLIISGINDSFGAILPLIIAYIMVFYIILGILEDSGYLTRAVVLLDTTMHRFGLHGGAFIPMIVGVGCNVPAIMATRSIRSRRERLILSTMIVIAVPCSAQMAIIMGVTGAYAGILYAFLILLVMLVLIVILGLLLNKYLKYEPSNLAMEMPDLVMPQAKNVLFKTWERIRDFFVIAFPLLVVGGIIIEFAVAYDWLDPIVDPLSFLTVSMLGLPAVTIIAFIAGIVRKEMALGLLIILLGEPLTMYMAPEQFVVFGMVMAVFMPCLATLAVLWREMGWRDTALICLGSFGVALALGTLFHLGFMLF